MARAEKILIFIPTYNERENVVRLFEGILNLKIQADILFLDDNSPDGTGQILDDLAQKNSKLTVIHRAGKLGVGSAHQRGIRWAYERGYDFLITMDSDFTHPPEYILELLNNADGFDVVVGSRYMVKNGLEGWNLYRKILTKLGHWMTRLFLRLKYDATGALRLYRLGRIPIYAFDLVASKGYSFFYESLFILDFNHFRIKEIPIKLPTRTYGHSKMKFSDNWQSLKRLVLIFVCTLFEPYRFKVIAPIVLPSTDNVLKDREEWEQYWTFQKGFGGLFYDIIALFYRKCFIKRSLNFFIKKYFRQSQKLLHAGCGGGQVDEDIHRFVDITALDYSVNALNFYKVNNQSHGILLYGSIFNVPLPDESVDGVYNLGVMEHYTEEDVQKILLEFKRVLIKDGKIVLFWPPEFGLSVIFMKVVHFILQKVFRQNAKMHPDEICRIRSREHALELMHKSGFEMLEYYFGPKDFFTQCVIVARPVK